MLIVLAGLPGSGKSTLARAVAQRLGAVWLRIDSIEQALRDAHCAVTADEGYRTAYAVAADNLRLGLPVVADCVNPLPVTRDAWVAVARGANVAVHEIEVICSDAGEHRRRIETRLPEIPGLVLPTWAEVVARDYRPWTRERLVIDTAGRGIDECVAWVLANLP